jgi:uncharacterized membrane protein required for colicin V production
MEIIKKINWIDIFVVILLFRIGYVSINSGLIPEIFKLSGTILAIYVSLHYYTAFVGLLAKAPIVKNILPLKFLDFLSFVILAILAYFIFALLRKGFSRIFKIEAVPGLKYWGGFVLGIIRAFFLCGLIVFMLVISGTGYLKNSVRNSYSGKYLIRIAPKTYGSLWYGLFSKFMTGEEFNRVVLEAQENLIQ